MYLWSRPKADWRCSLGKWKHLLWGLAKFFNVQSISKTQFCCQSNQTFHCWPLQGITQKPEGSVTFSGEYLR